MNRIILKANASSKVKERIFPFAMAIIAFFLSQGILSSLSKSASVLFSLFITSTVYYGINFMCLKTSRNEDVEFFDVFFGFKNFWNVFLLNFFSQLFVYLWSLLLFVPGIIANISYSFAPFIMADNPGISALDAISLSKKMTNGHKADLFILSLSFFPWFIIGFITLGLGFCYVVPYYKTTYAIYYNEVKNDTVFIKQEREFEL